MVVRNRRAERPALERLEGRELLSAIVALESAQAPVAPSAINVIDSRTITPASTSGALPGVGLTAYSGNTGAAVGQSLNNNTNTPLLGNGLPTPAELARETFHASFSGRVYTGPGRFSSQGTTYYFRGLGGSNFFLHGDFDMAVVTPTDPNAAFLGEAVMNDKSTNSSGILGLILTASRTAVDSQGRPTQLTFTADPSIYSGVFFVDAAQGTVNIKYGPRDSIKATFNGLIYTTGLTSPLVNQDLYARQGRPVAYHPTNNLTKIHNV